MRGSDQPVIEVSCLVAAAPEVKQAADPLKSEQLLADLLGLRSSIRGGQRNYLTYSVLGGLMARGEVVQNRETKVFNKAEATR